METVGNKRTYSSKIHKRNIKKIKKKKCLNVNIVIYYVNLNQDSAYTGRRNILNILPIRCEASLKSIMLSLKLT